MSATPNSGCVNFILEAFAEHHRIAWESNSYPHQQGVKELGCALLGGESFRQAIAGTLIAVDGIPIGLEDWLRLRGQGHILEDEAARLPFVDYLTERESNIIGELTAMPFKLS